jgi:transcriptional regulator with XRE-family HTH domain
VDDDGALAERVAKNLRSLRGARALSQVQAAKAAGLPRATWANLESGGSNPTLMVIHRAACALHVTIEELIAPPRAEVQHFPVGTLPVRRRGAAVLRQLLPDALPGFSIERLELPPGGAMTGAPHTPGTREYLACERGTIVLSAAGQRHRLGPGDVLVFRGDQRHAYGNDGAGPAVAYSAVLLVAPASGRPAVATVPRSDPSAALSPGSPPPRR